MRRKLRIRLYNLSFNNSTMQFQYNKNLKSTSQELRRAMTPEERHLWYDFLKKLPVTVKRQQIIGNFIVDFYIPSKLIAIELDGIQHTTSEHFRKDKERDFKLSRLGISVLRYTNVQVNGDFANVCRDIANHIKGNGEIG